MLRIVQQFFAFLFSLGIVVNCCAAVLNDPNLKTKDPNVYYTAFVAAPKTLDPARSYTNEEWIFIAQIYEPLLQYHYLKRPVTLIPLTALQMPQVRYYNANDQLLSNQIDSSVIAYSVYEIAIQPSILYQPHPAFATDHQGQYRYHHLHSANLRRVHQLSDFAHTGTRELTAEDYVYSIKRLADPTVSSPIFGLMSEKIIGLKEYAQQLRTAYAQQKNSKAVTYLDLRKYPLTGVNVLDRYHFQIKVKGVFPQLNYWLATSFFSPIPWEAIYFYSQPGMKKRNLTLDWYPVGTGPYQLTKNNPNQVMLLTRNPNFHGELYPREGEVDDEKKAYLKNSGQPMPFIDQVIFSLDKESIPRWNKFLQGYYDKSTISEDNFDQAIHLDAAGNPQLTKALKQKKMYLQTTITPSIYGMGFNMLDKVVGGSTDKKRKLRQAISIALDEDEYIAIFLNGRGLAAQGPIPPGIFGYQAGVSGINSNIYQLQNSKLKRKSLTVAKRLLTEAGYPYGIDPKTGRALILNYDTPTSGSPDDYAQFNWYRKQFAKLGIQLNINATLYNRFLDKLRHGDVQLFFFAWLADYPDPENFLALLYGENAKVKYGGENNANYQNPQFDNLFEKMKDLPNGPQRQQIINQMVQIVRNDSPWIWGFHPISFVLNQSWDDPSKAHPVANNTLKYQRLDYIKRAALIKSWNQAILWPVALMVLLVALVFLPLVFTYWRREFKPNVRRF